MSIVLHTITKHERALTSSPQSSDTLTFLLDRTRESRHSNGLWDYRSSVKPKILREYGHAPLASGDGAGVAKGSRDLELVCRRGSYFMSSTNGTVVF